MTDPLGLAEDEHHEHPVWGKAQTAIETVESCEDPPEDQQSLMASTCAVLAYLLGLRSCPSPIVTRPYLDKLATQVDGLQSAIQNWLSSPADHADSVRQTAEALAAAVRAYPTTKDSFSHGVRSAFEVAWRSAQERLDELQDEVAKQLASLESVSEESEKVRKEARDELGALQSTIQESAETITTQTTRLDTALTKHQSAFTEAESTRQSQFGDALQSLKDDQSKLRRQVELDADAAREDLAKHAQEVLDKLARLDEHASELVGAIGIKGTATNYGLYAKQERRTANILRGLAVLLFLAAFGVFLVFVLLEHIDGGTPWQAIVVRLGSSVALLAGGTYAARESAQHRTEERQSKDTELLLNALEPFIANLTIPDDKEKIRKKVARRIFVEGRGTTGSSARKVDDEQESATKLDATTSA